MPTTLVALLIASAMPEVSAAGGSAKLDDDCLIVAFELTARGEPGTTVRSIDYTVTSEGKRLFGFGASGFEMPREGERPVIVAGFGDNEGSAALRDRLPAGGSFPVRVEGVLHLDSRDVPFSVTVDCELPAPKVLRKRVPGHSLLSY